jgi:hypothetical protein
MVSVYYKANGKLGTVSRPNKDKTSGGRKSSSPPQTALKAGFFYSVPGSGFIFEAASDSIRAGSRSMWS